MQKVFVAQHHPEAYFVCGLLEASGIDAEVRGEDLFTTVGGAAVIPGASPEVWVLNPDQAASALELIHRYSMGEPSLEASGTAWPCPTCGEVHEPQFTACWKCGAARPGPISAD